jgi:hypothetical protein
LNNTYIFYVQNRTNYILLHKTEPAQIVTCTVAVGNDLPGTKHASFKQRDYIEFVSVVFFIALPIQV